MNPTTYYVVALSTPCPGVYYNLHFHTARHTAEWTLADTQRYQEIVQLIRAGKTLRQDSSGVVLSDPARDGRSGSVKVLPYLLEIQSLRRPKHTILEDRNMAVIDRSIIPESKVRPTLLNKSPEALIWSPEILSSIDTPPDGIEGRSSPALLQAVASSKAPTLGGDLQLAVVPGDAKARIGRNSQGEFVREVPRTWA